MARKKEGCQALRAEGGNNRNCIFREQGVDEVQDRSTSRVKKEELTLRGSKQMIRGTTQSLGEKGK